jgi:hypothetical protein
MWGRDCILNFFLLTEMKCRDSWRNVFLSSTMINKMLDKWQLTENLTVWELWYFKAVTSYRGERFQVPTRLTTVTRQTGEYKVDLTRHPKFLLAFGELASGRFPHCDDITISYIWSRQTAAWWNFLNSYYQPYFHMHMPFYSKNTFNNIFPIIIKLK